LVPVLEISRTAAMAPPAHLTPVLTPFGFSPTFQEAVDYQRGVSPEGVGSTRVQVKGHGHRGMTEALTPHAE